MLFIQLGKYQVKYMNVYIVPLIDELIVLRNGFTMYDICGPIGQKQFQFHAIILWIVHDVLGLMHLYCMLC